MNIRRQKTKLFFAAFFYYEKSPRTPTHRQLLATFDVAGMLATLQKKKRH